MSADPIRISDRHAQRVHAFDEPRRSGEPYMNHPRSVARSMPILHSDPDIDFRKVDLGAAKIESMLHDIFESRVKQRAKDLGRPLSRQEEENVIREAKRDLVRAFAEEGYGLRDKVSEHTTVADIIYDLDSLTHRRYWRQDVKAQHPDWTNDQIKQAAYMIGHERLKQRSLWAQHRASKKDPGAMRMTAVGVKLGDTKCNKFDNPTPSRGAIYGMTIPDLIRTLALAAEDVTRHHRSSRREDNVISMKKPPQSVRPVRFSLSPSRRDAAYG